jgi:hypothetical protein
MVSIAKESPAERHPPPPGLLASLPDVASPGSLRAAKQLARTEPQPEPRVTQRDLTLPSSPQ